MTAALLSVLKYPHAALRQPGKEVDVTTDLDGVFLHRVEELKALEIEHNAAGIAATQCGWMVRVVIVNGEVLLNPRVVDRSHNVMSDTEGCLSFPGVTESMPADLAVAVEYDTLDGQRCMQKAFVGPAARAVQHEIDHVNGKTMDMRMGILKRRDFIRRYKQVNGL